MEQNLKLKKKVVRIESPRELCVMYMAINKVLHDTKAGRNGSIIGSIMHAN